MDQNTRKPGKTPAAEQSRSRKSSVALRQESRGPKPGKAAASASTRQRDAATGDKEIKSATKKSKSAKGRSGAPDVVQVASVPQPKSAAKAHAGGSFIAVDPGPITGASASRPAPLRRSWLLARLASTAMTSIQFLPGTEELQPGLLVAAAVILVLDVTIEIGTTVTTMLRTMWNAVSVDNLFAGRDHKGNVRMSGGIIFKSLPPRPKIRVAARTTSALLIATQWASSVQELHSELLILALALLLIDVSTHISTRMLTMMRKKFGPAPTIRYNEERSRDPQER